MISPFSAWARWTASAVLPAAVGPTMTRRGAAAAGRPCGPVSGVLMADPSSSDGVPVMAHAARPAIPVELDGDHVNPIGAGPRALKDVGLGHVGELALFVRLSLIH